MANDPVNGNDQLNSFEDDIELDDLDIVSYDTPDEEVVAVEGIQSIPQQTTGIANAGLDLDFSSLTNVPGITVGTLGQVVSRLPVEKIKFSKGKRELINIVTQNPLILKTHYKQGIGNFLCFGGACCDTDLARVRYVFPINVYDTNRDGKVVSTKLTPMALAVGEEQYRDLVTISEVNGPLPSVQILVSCKDEQYQRISLQCAGPDMSHNNPKFAAELEKMNRFWQQNAKNLVKAIARSITPQEYAEAISDEVSGGAASVDFDQIFGV